MKILLAGGYDTQNLGDYASFAGLRKLLLNQNVEPEFTVLTRHTNDLFTKEFDVKPILNMDHTNKAASQGRIFNGFNEGDNRNHLHQIADSMLESDLVMIGNGRLFIDIAIGFMKGPLAYFQQLIMLAKFLNKPVILFSVTLVEPSTEAGKEILGFILQNADKIIVREPHSVAVASRYLKDTKKVICLPDIAFALDRNDAELDSPVSIPKNTIGVNFRGVNYDSTSGKAALNNMVNCIKQIMEWAPNIIFCQQGTYDTDTLLTDDRHIHQQVYGALPSELQSRCILYRDKLSMAQTLGLYQQLEHLYTTRRHGFIMSLTQDKLASLFCDEENTSVVQESINIPSLFLNKKPESLTSLPDKNHLKTAQEQIMELRNKLTSYPEELCKVL